MHCDLLENLLLDHTSPISSLLQEEAQLFLHAQAVTQQTFSEQMNEYRQAITKKKLTILSQEKNEQYQHCIWQLEGFHSGILKQYLPSRKKLTIHGELTVFYNSNHQLTHLSLFVDQASVIQQIETVSDKHYELNDFTNVDNLSDDTIQQFKEILQANNPPSNINQELTNTFRRNLLKAPQGLPDEMKSYLQSLQQATHCQEVLLPLAGRECRALYYTPKNYDKQANDKLFLYFHGGGWVMLSPDFYDAQSRDICQATSLPVLAIDYRLAPENPFPAGFDDCYDSYHYLRTTDTTSLLGQTFNTIMFGGDSCGGTYSTGVVNKCLDENLAVPDKLLLLFPATDLMFENYKSFTEKAYNDVMITMALASCQRAIYAPYPYWQHPYYSPIHGAIKNYPDTLMFSGEVDPLCEENTVFANKFKQNNQTQLTHIITPGYTHDYTLFLPLADVSRQAYQRIASFLTE